MNKKEKECKREYRKKHKTKIKMQKRAYRQKIRQVYNKFIEDVKRKGKCVICGYIDYRCLVFHHKNRVEKKYTIGVMVNKRMPIKEIKEEIKKCILVCGNCHLILHYRKGG